MVRIAKAEDCINIAALSIQVWLDTYAVEGIRTQYSSYVLSNFTEDYFLSLLDNIDYRLLVSESDDVLQGFVLVNLTSHFEDANNGFEIEKLYVHDKFKGQGIGRQLLSEVERNIGENFWLYTWVENESNEFYKHLGFHQIGQLNFEFSGHLIENNVYRYGRIQQGISL